MRRLGRVSGGYSVPYLGQFLALYSMPGGAGVAHLESGGRSPELFAGLGRWRFRHALL
jgi:hypothetical protein